MTATATKPSAAKQAAHLTPEVRRALCDLLYRLADDALIIGHRNSEWTGLAPILEEDIAFSSMAQDKMGQAWVLYGLLHEIGEAVPDKLAFARDPAQFRSCGLVALPRGDWSFSLVRQFFVSEADMLRWTALGRSTFPPLASLAAKFHGELKYHQMHDRAWIKRLGRANAESRSRLQLAVNELYGHGLGQFEPTATESSLVQAGIAQLEAELCKSWRVAIESLLAEASLTVAKNADAVHGGRQGRHSSELIALLESMQRVFRLDPEATW